MTHSEHIRNILSAANLDIREARQIEKDIESGEAEEYCNRVGIPLEEFEQLAADRRASAHKFLQKAASLEAAYEKK
jgi:hypothetical protein